MEKIIENIQKLDENWMHKTKGEKVTEIREAVLDLEHLVFDRKIEGYEICEVLTGINKMMLKLHEAVCED